MLKKISKNVLTIVSLCMAIITSIMGYFLYNYSAAWMAKNEEVLSSGLGVSVAYCDDFESIKYYHITATQLADDGQSTHNDYIFLTDDSVLQSEARSSFEIPLNLNTYSDLEGNAQVLMEIDLKDESPLLKNPNLTISIQTTTTTFWGHTLANATTEFNVDPSGNNPMSSIINFWAFGAIQNSSYDGKSCYVVSSLDLDAAGKKTFIDVNNDVATFSVPQNVQVPIVNKKFFILFDYNEAAVEIINNQLAEYVDRASAAIPGYDTITLGETLISFECDFRFVVSEGTV